MQNFWRGIGYPLAFSQAIDGDGAKVFAAVAQLGCAVFELIGAEKTSTVTPSALRARRTEKGLVFAGNAFIGLAGEERDLFWRNVEQRAVPTSPYYRSAQESGDMAWRPVSRPRFAISAGRGMLRHANLRRLVASATVEPR